MFNKMRKIGQSINEYVLVITLVTLAGVGMQAYIKRGIQGIVKISADKLAGETGDKVAYSGTEKSILPRSQWNPVAVEYEKNRISGGFFVAEKTGNQVYYTHYPDKNDLNNKVIIGGENLSTHEFTSFDWEGYADAVYTKDGKVSITPQDARANYSKYEIVSPSSEASKSIVQSGVIESGLIKFEQKSPIKIERGTEASPNKITVETTSISSGPRSLAGKDWHPAMTAYLARMKEDKIPGFIQTEIKGSKVYYYVFTTDINNKTLMGGEDLRTHDFTGFDPDGFPVSTVDSNLKALRTYSGYVIDPETKEIVGVKDEAGNIYRKGQIVTIRSVPLSVGPETIGKVIRTKTIEKDETHVTGAWEATYKLESANTFGAKDKTQNQKSDKTTDTTGVAR